MCLLLSNCLTVLHSLKRRTLNFSKILLPSILSISVYLIINKLLAKKVESLGKDPIEALSDGVLVAKR